MSQKKSKYTFAVSTIISALISITFAVAYFSDPVGALERGPRYVFFLLIGSAAGVAAAVVFGFFWVRRAKGRRLAIKYVMVFIILGVIGVPVYFYSGYIQHQQYHKIIVNGVERQYLIYMPSTYTAEKPVPLLLALHGGMGNAKQFEDETDFNQIAEKYGFIVVYPDGLGYFPYSFHLWNSGYIKAASDMGTDDVGFLTTLIANLEETYSIDTSRVYLAGHSNGGMMTDRMAAEHPELFAAVAPISSSVGGKATPDSPTYIIPTPNQPVTIIRVHGLQDQNVLYNGGYSESGFGSESRYDNSEKQSTTFWVNLDQCNTTPIVTNSTYGQITMQRFTGGQNGTEVVLVTLDNENHFFENMNNAVQNEQFYGDSLAEMIWNLLKEYSKPA